ncbi:MAG: hypothetical protein ACLTXJ_09395 [Barnesiella sp.]
MNPGRSGSCFICTDQEHRIITQYPTLNTHTHTTITITHTTSSLKNYLSPQSRTAPSQSARLRYRQSTEAPGSPDV